VKKSERLKQEFEMVAAIIDHYQPLVDPCYHAPTEEFVRRHEAVARALGEAGHTVGFVFSDEEYCGDVPYLGGNTGVSVEQVAGVIGPTGFHLVAGLEGGYLAEQLSKRANAVVHKVELLQLADEEYPVKAERLEDVLAQAAGRPLANIESIALLTPRQVVPAALVEYLETVVGKDRVQDAQELYQRIKNRKSDVEMRLIRDASTIADAMLRGMLAVLKPGMLETEVAAWADFIARELGSEEAGVKTIVNANVGTRTIFAPAGNRIIRAGDWVNLGAVPKRDGLNACVRRTVVLADDPGKVCERDRFWFDFIEQAYRVGYRKYEDVARNRLPAKLQEQALVDFFKSKSREVSKMVGKTIDLERLKPYTGTHNSGYTECQEFYGAITLGSEGPLDDQIVTMLDVALRGYGDRSDETIIPGLDYIVIENTLGKFGDRVETLTVLPLNVQSMVGNTHALR